MPNIVLKLDKIREFISFADKIKPAENIELLSTKDYIKLEIIMEECFLTKHNIYAFIKHSFQANDQNDIDGLLIHEKILTDFVKTCAESKKNLFIKYEVSENTMVVEISDNEKMKNKQTFRYSMDSVKIELFPSDKITPSSYGKTRLLEDVLSSINIAKGFVSKDNGGGDLFLAMYIEGNCIYASDRFTFYYKKLNHTNLPKIAITLEQTRIFTSDIRFIDYSVTDTHNLYFKGNTIYGFRQIEGTKGYDYKQFFEPDKKNYIRVRVEDLMLFCNRTKNLSNIAGSSFIASRCTIEGNEAIFKYIDTDYGNENINEVDILESNGVVESFSLNHTLWYDLLRPLPYTEIIINHNPKMPFISITSTEDKEFYCVVSKVNL